MRERIIRGSQRRYLRTMRRLRRLRGRSVKAASFQELCCCMVEGGQRSRNGWRCGRGAATQRSQWIWVVSDQLRQRSTRSLVRWCSGLTTSVRNVNAWQSPGLWTITRQSFRTSMMIRLMTGSFMLCQLLCALTRCCGAFLRLILNVQLLRGLAGEAT